MARFVYLCPMILAYATALAAAVVVDHRHVDAVEGYSQATMDAIGQQKWFFTHASVGSNILMGMGDLNTTSPTRYQLVVRSIGFWNAMAEEPPSPTLPGSVYECGRGNPGYQDKFDIFTRSVTIAGWHDPQVNVVMDKLCFLDSDADATAYINAMTALEASYPNTVVVYVTMPLTTDETPTANNENILRNQYNAAVRAFCMSNNKLLFDIADMEAFDPVGNPQTFTYEDNVYQRLYEGYTWWPEDNAHLDTPGQRRIAKGWYAVAAVIALGNCSADLNGDGQVDQADFALFWPCISGSGVPHNGLPTCTSSDMDHDGDVDQSDFGLFQLAYNSTAIFPQSNPGDLNGDGHADQNDVSIFGACRTGAGVIHDGSPASIKADMDHDGDVDQDDFGMLQRCLSGALPVDPACAD